MPLVTMSCYGCYVSPEKRVLALASTILASSPGLEATQAIAIAVRIINELDRWEAALLEEMRNEASKPD